MEPENRTMAEEPKTEPKPWNWSEMKIVAACRPWWARPFAWFNWGAEWTAHGLSNWAFIKVIEYLGKLSLVVGVIFYFMEAPTRRKQAQYDAWRVITSNAGQPGSGGRIQALQDLNKDGVDLSGVDLHKAFLGGINLQQANLAGANLSGAHLIGAHLIGVNLSEAHLSEAILIGVNLSGVDLFRADLSKAKLWGADLSGANLGEADLRGADLRGAYLSKADLRGADLSGADLSRAHLGRANLSGANLSKAKLSWADLSGAMGLTQVQVDSARGSEGTKLPEELVRPKHWAQPPTK
jgi:uncharacterized protein YjbI with pentapeptide repeats